jgi:hypothetical protein
VPLREGRSGLFSAFTTVTKPSIVEYCGVYHGQYEVFIDRGLTRSAAGKPCTPSAAAPAAVRPTLDTTTAGRSGVQPSQARPRALCQGMTPVTVITSPSPRVRLPDCNPATARRLLAPAKPRGELTAPQAAAAITQSRGGCAVPNLGRPAGSRRLPWTDLLFRRDTVL